MNRGEIWIAADGDISYAGKPRPFLIVQGPGFEALDSITVIGFTSNEERAPFRPLLAPFDHNGLRQISQLMVDKILTLPKRRLDRQVGVLAAADMEAVDEALITVLGLA